MEREGGEKKTERERENNDGFWVAYSFGGKLVSG
jgi:hypothetical protein